MAKCIELTIEDDGTMYVSMEDKVDEEQEGGEEGMPTPGSPAEKRPVANIKEAMGAIMQMASQVLSEQEQDGFQEGFTGKKPNAMMGGM